MPDCSLSALTYDPDGCLDLTFAGAAEGIRDRGRRVSRVQTLDGEVAITDGGMVHGDRTFVLRARVSPSQREILQHLFESYGELRCSTHDGLYRVIAQGEQALTFTGNLATIRLFVVRKEA